MSVDAATVRRIAHLARIAVTDAEVPHLQGELNAMLAFVEQLSEVDTSSIDPAIGGLTREGELTDSSRDDMVTASLGQKLALEEAPDAAAGYWVANLRAGFEQQSKRWRFSEYARLDNLANRNYVGSVIVNESNSRFFEAAPGRTAYIMFNAAMGAE